MSDKTVPSVYTPSDILATDSNFEQVEKRIAEELIHFGELESKDDNKNLPRMMIQCFEEFGCTNSLTREQVLNIWNNLTDEQKKKVIDGLNSDKGWF
jgi:hypothetical protein